MLDGVFSSSSSPSSSSSNTPTPLAYPMSAGVAGSNPAQASPRETFGHRAIGQHLIQKLRHLSAVAGNQEITPRLKEVFAIAPGSRNHGNATGQRFERTNRRNARQH